MWPLLVPMGRGGVSGKALAVGAAQRVGGADGVLEDEGRRANVTDEETSLASAKQDETCSPLLPLLDRMLTLVFGDMRSKRLSLQIGAPVLVLPARDVSNPSPLMRCRWQR
jgi:hypothetical protein